MTVIAVLALRGTSRGQELSRRLILKDGTYQLVTKYETKGDRVRYFSAEREEWEELPTSLVDWPATEKYEKDRAKNDSIPEAVALDKEVEHDRELAEAKLPQIAPGLRLPADSGVFLFDSFQGEPQIVEIQQTAGDVNRNTKANLLRGAINPIAGVKQTIEVEGTHAKVQAHVGVPSIYINVEDAPGQAGSSGPAGTGSAGAGSTRNGSVDTKSADANTPEGPQQPEQPEQAIVPYDRFLIVRAEVKGGRRVVGAGKRAATGNISQEQHVVPTTIDRVSGGWLKITPTQPLAPGEYALVESSPTEGMNLYLWDFGVNPKAPANANPWTPEAPSGPSKPSPTPASTPH